eukprot:TRINITY_DN892_c0_g1_i6.p1 TRINITY_DN892_c0_g1~~TRINITY_DN892_c0_g1_i6.p1  ORF type:complete len:170 (-),score=32.27 TRINITY_DN892_c0_g1_i6:151-660(-)
MDAVLLHDQSLLLRIVLLALPSSLDVRRGSAVCRAWRALCLRVLAHHHVPEVAWSAQRTQLPVNFGWFAQVAQLSAPFDGHAVWYCPQQNTLTLYGGDQRCHSAGSHNQVLEVAYHAGQGQGSPSCKKVYCELRGTTDSSCCAVTDDGRKFLFGYYVPVGIGAGNNFVW